MTAAARRPIPVVFFAFLLFVFLARVVSSSFSMGDLKPDQTIEVDGRTLYLWTIK